MDFVVVIVCFVFVVLFVRDCCFVFVFLVFWFYTTKLDLVTKYSKHKVYYSLISMSEGPIRLLPRRLLETSNVLLEARDEILKGYSYQFVNSSFKVEHSCTKCIYSTDNVNILYVIFYSFYNTGLFYLRRPPTKMLSCSFKFLV